MGAKHQAITFAVIGVLSTAAYLVLYAIARSEMPPHVANGVALLLSTAANTQVNRRLTFGIRGTRDLLADHLAGLGAFGIALAITSGSLGLLLLTRPHAGILLETTVLIAGNVLATISRFFLLRWWMTRHVYIVLRRKRAGD